MAVYSRIAGTGSYLPERVLTNADLEKMVDTNDEWIVSRSGIRERHLAAEGETTCDLAYHAAMRALEAAGMRGEEIELVVLGTTTPDIISTHLHADGGKKELLYNPKGVSVGFDTSLPNAGVKVLMAGSDVFKYAVKALDSVVEETLAANGLDKHEIDWLIPHQANLRIIEATAKRLDMPMERVIITVDRHGNTSAGSVP